MTDPPHGNATQHPTISTETSRGATIYTSYATRQVKAYPVFESEIETFNLFNTLTLAAFAIGAAFIAYAMGIWTNAAFAENLSPTGVLATKLVAPILCVLALISFGLGVWARHRRATTWAQIKRESASRLEATPPTPANEPTS